jgi:hypothetical protein
MVCVPALGKYLGGRGDHRASICGCARVCVSVMCIRTRTRIHTHTHTQANTHTHTHIHIHTYTLVAMSGDVADVALESAQACMSTSNE